MLSKHLTSELNFSILVFPLGSHAGPEHPGRLDTGNLLFTPSVVERSAWRRAHLWCHIYARPAQDTEPPWKLVGTHLSGGPIPQQLTAGGWPRDDVCTFAGNTPDT